MRSESGGSKWEFCLSYGILSEFIHRIISHQTLAYLKLHSADAVRSCIVIESAVVSFFLSLALSLSISLALFLSLFLSLALSRPLSLPVSTSLARTMYIDVSIKLMSSVRCVLALFPSHFQLHCFRLTLSNKS